VDLAHPKLYEPRGVPDDTIGVVVDCSRVVARKAAALRAHRTQANDMGDLTEDMEEAALGTECHVIAWPPAPPAVVLTDVFEGL
jgi:LmbE family N-acetylglucosaminyl deacetylase